MAGAHGVFVPTGSHLSAQKLLFSDLGPLGAAWHRQHAGTCRGVTVPAEEGWQAREAELALLAGGPAGPALPGETWKRKLRVHQEAAGDSRGVARC